MRDKLSSMTLSPHLFVYKNLVLYIVNNHIKSKWCHEKVKIRMVFVIVLKYYRLFQVNMLLNLFYPIVFKCESLILHYSNIINRIHARGGLILPPKVLT